MNYPTLVQALREFDIITEEQANDALTAYADAYANWEWWYALSDIAWSNLPWWKRAFRSKLGWKLDWMNARR